MPSSLDPPASRTSVVIPTNEAGPLGLLTGLDCDQLEVIVVDDSSTTPRPRFRATRGRPRRRGVAAAGLDGQGVRVLDRHPTRNRRRHRLRRRRCRSDHGRNPCCGSPRYTRPRACLGATISSHPARLRASVGAAERRRHDGCRNGCSVGAAMVAPTPRPTASSSRSHAPRVRRGRRARNGARRSGRGSCTHTHGRGDRRPRRVVVRR